LPSGKPRHRQDAAITGFASTVRPPAVASRVSRRAPRISFGAALTGGRE